MARFNLSSNSTYFKLFFLMQSFTKSHLLLERLFFFKLIYTFIVTCYFLESISPWYNIRIVATLFKQIYILYWPFQVGYFPNYKINADTSLLHILNVMDICCYRQTFSAIILLIMHGQLVVTWSGLHLNDMFNCLSKNRLFLWNIVAFH